MKRAALFLAGCLFIGLMASPAAAQTVIYPDTTEVQFFDSNSFDKKLSAALDEKTGTVIATLLAPVSINSLPERLDKWLQAVEKNEGTVELKPEQAQRGLGLMKDALSLAKGVYKKMKDAALYRPAKLYNATVYFKSDTGNITRIVFTRKPAEEG